MMQGGDMIAIYKIICGEEKVYRDNYFLSQNTKTKSI